jgi:hypothetical protein
MGTKNNPGDYDCYQHAHPDEPMFVLLGRDPLAGLLVRLWAEARAELGTTSEEKLAEAYRCADAMGSWAIDERKSVAVAKAALHKVMLKRGDLLVAHLAEIGRAPAKWPPDCDNCRAPWTRPGALVFGPPNEAGECVKMHLCKICYGAFERKGK